MEKNIKNSEETSVEIVNSAEALEELIAKVKRAQKEYYSHSDRTF